MTQNKKFLYVGNWGFAPAPKGISIFEYNSEDGRIRLVQNVRQDIAAGQLCLDAENLILYATNECGDRTGEIGGGGYVYAFRIDPETGELTLFSQQDSLSPEPSYLCMTADKKYIMTCHCADPWHVTKIVKDGNTFRNEVLFDDTAVVLFPIAEDGSIEKPCDVMITEGNCRLGERSSCKVDPVSKHIQLVEVISRLHSIYRSPDGKLFITLDKGMDRLITFRIDEEAGKIVPLSTYTVEEVASFPRYGAFHPTLPIFYANNENRTLLNVFSYDEKGVLTLLTKIELTQKKVGLIDGKPAGCQDMIISRDAANLYISLSGLNEIAVVALDKDGMPELVGEISSEGNFPRCLQFDPQERFVYAGNMVSGDITQFRRMEGGLLEYSGNKYLAVSPSAMQFLE